MNILILGGTVFLGRHLVEAAQAQGHTVTLFNRGKSNPEVFPDVEKLVGDRSSSDLEALKGRTWDAVIDTSGYVPRIVGESAALLADAVGHYTFISSISVYPHPMPAQADETSPVGKLDDENVEEITGDTYGPLKALCEQAIERALPGRALNIRPGLIVGPNDPSDRFTYWVLRLARGGNVLVPDALKMQVQVIDVRDLAAWIVRLVEAQVTGLYLGTGPDYPLTLETVLNTCQQVSGGKVQYTVVSEAFLQEQEVEPWTGLPLWLPPDLNTMHQINVQKAIAAGLTFRPLAETVRDTLAWAQTRPNDYEPRAGITAEKEAEVLRAWREQAQQPAG